MNEELPRTPAEIKASNSSTQPIEEADGESNSPSDEVTRVPLEQKLEDHLSSDFGEILGPEEAHKVAGNLATFIRREYYSGPLPHPAHMSHYNDILPGSADRILKMAEKQQEHTSSAEREIINAETTYTKLGLFLGAGIFCLLILSALLTALILKSSVVPGVFLGTAVIGGVGYFVNGKRSDT